MTEDNLLNKYEFRKNLNLYDVGDSAAIKEMKNIYIFIINF